MLKKTYCTPPGRETWRKGGRVIMNRSVGVIKLSKPQINQFCGLSVKHINYTGANAGWMHISRSVIYMSHVWNAFILTNCLFINYDHLVVGLLSHCIWAPFHHFTSLWGRRGRLGLYSRGLECLQPWIRGLKRVVFFSFVIYLFICLL